MLGLQPKTSVTGPAVLALENSIMADEKELKDNQKQVKAEEQVLEQDEKEQQSEEKQLDREQKTLDSKVKALIKSPKAAKPPVTPAQLAKEDSRLKQERVNTGVDEAKTLSDRADLKRTEAASKKARQDISAVFTS